MEWFIDCMALGKCIRPFIFSLLHINLSSFIPADLLDSTVHFLEFLMPGMKLECTLEHITSDRALCAESYLTPKTPTMIYYASEVKS